MLKKLLLSDEEIQEEKMKEFIKELGKGIQVLLDTYGKQELLKELEK